MKHLTAAALLLLLNLQLFAYADNMGYLELKIPPGHPTLKLFINGKAAGSLGSGIRRLYLKTGIYTIRLEGKDGWFRYTLRTTCRVQEDITSRKFLKPVKKRIRHGIPAPVRKKTPPGKIPGNKKTAVPGGTGKVYAGPNRPVLFIRPAGQPGVRISLFLNSSWIGWLKPGQTIRRMARTGTKHWLLIRKYREGQRREEQKVFALEKAVGPKRILIYP